MTQPRAATVEHNEGGQALVEFAIVLPLLIMILLFAQWFWEVVQVKLKVQEAARFAAWEATAHPLHDYGQGRASLTARWSTMQATVMMETMVNYADLDSARPAAGLRMLSASWTPPVVFLANQQEELIYAGGSLTSPFINFIFKLAGQGSGIAAGMLYGWLAGNPYAAELAGGFSGAMKDVPFGATEWGFNDRGYNLATVSTYVKNEWFGVTFMGKPLIPTPGLFIRERNGVLADSWNLYPGQDAVQNGVMNTQVQRMYLMNERTRKKAVQLALLGPKPSGSDGAAAASGGGSSSGASNLAVPSLEVGLKTIRTMLSSYGVAFLSLPPGLDPSRDMFRGAVVSKNYLEGKRDSGRYRVQEDVPLAGGSRYETAPMSSENEATYRDRGNNFMGCTQPQKLGCTHTLGQDNPLGDYLVRE